MAAQDRALARDFAWKFAGDAEGEAEAFLDYSALVGRQFWEGTKNSETRTRYGSFSSSTQPTVISLGSGIASLSSA